MLKPPFAVIIAEAKIPATIKPTCDNDEKAIIFLISVCTIAINAP